jgi:hypothetical protein
MAKKTVTGKSLVDSQKPLKVGLRVKALVWNEVRTGTVTQDNGTGIVYVLWDGKEKPSWQHRESLSRVGPIRETLEEAGYTLVEKLFGGEVVLEARDTGKHEVWFHNPNHASYGIVIDGQDYEFARSL